MSRFVRNNTSDTLWIRDAGVFAEPGVPVEVPADVAGHAPKGKTGEEGHDPGAGLLAQTSTFEAVSQKDAQAELAAIAKKAEQSSNSDPAAAGEGELT